MDESDAHKFRWVQCQVDRIRTLRTANDVKHALGGLPPDLDQTYDNILLSVQPQDQEMLRNALQLVVFSARPLHVREVAEAVIIEPGTSEIDEDDRLQRPEDLLDIGKSLFVQNHTSHPTARFLELSHYSVKEYLLSERIKKGQAAAFAIDETCAELYNATCLLTYLGLTFLKTPGAHLTRKPGSQLKYRAWLSKWTSSSDNMNSVWKNTLYSCTLRNAALQITAVLKLYSAWYPRSYASYSHHHIMVDSAI